MSIQPVRRCACCGYLTVTEEYDICAVCGWEADNVQEANPSFSGGANKPSLDDARSSYAEMGASDPGKLAGVRAPLPHEVPHDIRER